MAFLYNQLFVTPPLPTHSFLNNTIIVTGSNIGLGLEAARHFAHLSASHIILAVRNTVAGEAAKTSILASLAKASANPLPEISVWPLDLASYPSVLAFVERCKTLPRLDVLCENAGIATGKFTLAESHESTLTVNVLSTFLLACLLLPKLAATAKEFHTKTHLTIVSSEVHGWTSFKERDVPNILAVLDDPKTADMGDRYQLSKLLEILIVRYITPGVTRSYPGVLLSTTNPGLCHSALARDAGWFLYVLKLLLARTTEVGSRTLVAPAVAGEESHGMYFTNGVGSDGDLSAFARSEEGAKAGEKVWAEVKGVLEGVQKGVTTGLE